MRRIGRWSLLLACVLVACTGDDGTSAVSTTVEPGAGEVGLDGMPPECVDALVGYLQAIEPVVQGVDFEGSDVDDLDALGAELEAVGEEYAAGIEALDCPEPEGTEEEAFDHVIALARSEAPGTVAYLDWARDFALSIQDLGESVTGDCEADIASLEAIIDRGGSMADLSMNEVVEVGSLVSSITTACSPERAEEFMSQDKVVRFLEE